MDKWLNLYFSPYKIVSNNFNETETDNGIVKLSLPLGDINSITDAIMDILNAIPNVLISADRYNKIAVHTINDERKNTKVPIAVLFDFKIFDL